MTKDFCPESIPSSSLPSLYSNDAMTPASESVEMEEKFPVPLQPSRWAGGGKVELNFQTILDGLELNIPGLRHSIDFRAATAKANWSKTLESDQSSIRVLEQNVESLPPKDRGYQAWMYTISIFFLEAVIWSIPSSYGVFLDYYTTELFPGAERFKLLPLIGTLSSGISYMGGTVIVPIIERYPHWRKEMIILGLVLCIASFMGAAFAKDPIHLVITQGVIYSISGAILYFPAVGMLNQWFDKNIGMASGIINSGMGVGSVFMPFIIKGLLYNHGITVTFLFLGLLVTVLVLPMVLYCRPRLPPKPKQANFGQISFLRRPMFLLFFVTGIFQSFANFLPGLYIPLFADHIGLTKTDGTLAVALLNVFSGPGIIAVCAISDRYDLRIAIAITTIGSALTILLMWGFVDKLATLLLFASVYGFLSAPYSALWPKFVHVIIDMEEESHLYGTVLSWVAVSRGVGNILEAPISTAIMRGVSGADGTTFAKGSDAVGVPKGAQIGYHLKGFGPLILVTGIAMAVSATGLFYPLLRHRRKQSLSSP